MTSDAAVGGESRLIGDLLQTARVGVEVDPLRAAEPHAVGVGDGVAKRPDKDALVDALLVAGVDPDEQLRGGIVDRAGLEINRRLWCESNDHRTAGEVDTDDRETVSGPIEPSCAGARFEVESEYLVREDADRRPSKQLVLVGGVHIAVPDATTATALRLRKVTDLANRTVPWA